MKGGLKSSMEWFMGVAAVIFMQKIANVLAVYNMAQTCAQYSGGFIADPSDCTSYGYCNNSVLVGTSRCPTGYVYNSRTAQCQAPTAEACSVGNVCQYAADKSFVANPSDCSTYYYCEKKIGKLVSCPRDQVFDSRSTSCTWKPQNQQNACPADSICRLVPNGKFLGDPNNCGQYISCANGEGSSGKCPDNTYFNKALGGCQYANPCQAATPVGIGLGVVTPLANNPTACKGQTNYPAYVSDGKTCMGYYVCEGASGPGAWRKCDANLHFSNGKCVSPCSYDCKYDRCGNMKQTFMGASATGCKNYLVCKNETSVAQAYVNYVGSPCPPDNPYFNEITQRCEPDTPASTKYVLCSA